MKKRLRDTGIDYVDLSSKTKILPCLDAEKNEVSLTVFEIQ